MHGEDAPGPFEPPEAPGPGRLPDPDDGVCTGEPPEYADHPLKLDQTTCAAQSEALKAAHDAMDVRMLLRIIGRLRNANAIDGWAKAVHAAKLGIRVKMVAKTAAPEILRS